MRPFPNEPDAILSAPFLPEPDWSRFARRMNAVLEQLGPPGTRVLVAERDPVAFTAALMAGVCRGCDVFLGSPDWRDLEWKQVSEVANFHRVFGDCPLPCRDDDPVETGSARIMVPTGGSSGGPRFCVHTLATLSSAVRSLCLGLGSGPWNSVNCLPLFHVSGLMQVIRALLTGGEAVFVPWKTLQGGAFEPKRPQASSISLVSRQLVRILELEGGPEWLNRFDRIFLGGGVTQPKWIDRIREHGLPAQFAYGLTETAAMIATGGVEEVDESGAVWARTLPEVDIGLTRAGEIEIDSASLFRGYYPENSEMGPFRTGDMGRMDESGRLTILGRKDLVIKSGGEKVNPAEVEAAILRLCGEVLPVALGLPDPDWGERLVVAVEGSPAQLDIAALRAELKKTLASHKIPKQFFTGMVIPRTASGKVDYSRLKLEVENLAHCH